MANLPRQAKAADPGMQLLTDLLVCVHNPGEMGPTAIDGCVRSNIKTDHLCPSHNFLLQTGVKICLPRTPSIGLLLAPPLRCCSVLSLSWQRTSRRHVVAHAQGGVSAAGGTCAHGDIAPHRSDVPR
jgi:hypothetical protein